MREFKVSQDSFPPSYIFLASIPGNEWAMQEGRFSLFQCLPYLSNQKSSLEANHYFFLQYETYSMVREDDPQRRH